MDEKAIGQKIIFPISAICIVVFLVIFLFLNLYLLISGHNLESMPAWFVNLFQINKGIVAFLIIVLIFSFSFEPYWWHKEKK